jgi:hypothetical protein
LVRISLTKAGIAEIAENLMGKTVRPAFRTLRIFLASKKIEIIAWVSGIESSTSPAASECSRLITPSTRL